MRLLCPWDFPGNSTGVDCHFLLQEIFLIFIYIVYKYSVQFSSVQSLSRVRLFVTPWTVAYEATPSMGFSRQKYWSGVPFPSAGDLPDPGMEPRSPALQADGLPSKPTGNRANMGVKVYVLSCI